MSEKIEKDGVEVEVFTADEVAAREQAAAKAEADRVAATKDAELAELRRLNAERGENFTRYSKMTEEEKKNYDENTTNLLKHTDKLTGQVEELTAKLTEKEKAENERTKNSALKGFHGDLPEVKQKLEEKYALLAGMPESTPEEITARAAEAAKLAGIAVDSRNPLNISIHGEPPMYKEKTEYTETNEGKEAAALARQALGVPEPKK